MKVVIFAGGFGTRLSEETAVRPKPMVEIGGRPILWHIMRHYAAHGLNDFVILGGYKVEQIRRYFLEYRQHGCDYTIELKSGAVRWLGDVQEDWRVTVLDTGLATMTGGRLARARDAIGAQTFCLTYGDGVSDVDLHQLLAFHKARNVWATVTAVAPPGRFGVLGLSETGDRVETFREKHAQDAGLINGGFFVCEPPVFDLIEGDESVWEQEPLSRLVALGRLAAYRHDGFWHAMDSLRDKATLEALWASGAAPWARRTR